MTYPTLRPLFVVAFAALPALAAAQGKPDAANDARKAQPTAAARQAATPAAKPTVTAAPRVAESKAVQPVTTRVPSAGKGYDGCGSQHAMKDSDA